MAFIASRIIWCCCGSFVLILLRHCSYEFSDGVPCCVFFFQAEDGIRDLTVTGVQTCALPISAPADGFVYRTERVDVSVGSVRDINGSLGPGQIASFVVHARAGQLLDLRVRSEFKDRKSVV